MTPGTLPVLAEASRMSPIGQVSPASRPVDDHLLRELVRQHHRFIWRLLGRIGVPEADVDDAVQQVFLVLAQRPGLQILVGSERSFLFGVALRVARTYRRSLRRRRDAAVLVDEPADHGPLPDALTDQRRARQMLDGILADMPGDLRLAFVLFEIEDLSTPEIASLLDLPAGTVASRLRRAREWFERRVKKLEAQRRLMRGER